MVEGDVTRTWKVLGLQRVTNPGHGESEICD